MSGRAITKGATDQSTVVRIIDDTTGVPEEAVEHNSSGIAFWYRREGGLKVAITLAALSALNDAHSDGGIEHIDDGYYRLDLPDAAVASGATGVMVGGFVTGMVVIGTYHSLVDFNSEGQSAIDLKDFADDGYDPSTNKVQGVVLTDTVTTYTGNTPQTGDAFARLGAPAGASVSADVAAVKVDTAAILVDTGTTLDGKIDTIDGIVDAILMDTDTTIPGTLATIAGYLDTEIAAIKAQTDNLPSGVKKNTALAAFEFVMLLTSDHYTAATGLTVTAERSIDGGALAACANSATEISNGLYKIDLAASDLNGDVITLRFSAATADDLFITILTEP